MLILGHNSCPWAQSREGRTSKKRVLLVSRVVIATSTLHREQLTVCMDEANTLTTEVKCNPLIKPLHRSSVSSLHKQNPPLPIWLSSQVLHAHLINDLLFTKLPVKLTEIFFETYIATYICHYLYLFHTTRF